ncbi:MAG: hypothetical protein ACJA0N_001366 [Pseudohongiellaceae bacterium]|jgi:hypothetical protein
MLLPKVLANACCLKAIKGQITLRFLNQKKAAEAAFLVEIELICPISL